MKKLNKKTLEEMLKNNYFIGCFKAVIFDKTNIYILYPFYQVRLSYAKEYGWSFIIYGECLYSTARQFIELVDNKLDNEYSIGE